ncbi:VOC family protein [Inquilinus sp. KBS0705]|nr:VOC family protein [Inquilinus sp. KBS0705]
MSKIVSYIHFNPGTCRQAMHFYQEVLGGELSIQIVKDSPMAAMFPPHLQDGVLHADLTNGNLTILASELSPADVSGQYITMMLVCDTKAELIEKFDKLAKGGNVNYPVETFFAGSMGNLTDKFGTQWGVFSDEK